MELGVLNINSHYIGSNSVSKIYKGTELVFEKVEFELIPFFEDNFNSGSLDTNNWYIDLGNGLSGWGNGQLEYASRKADNIKVEDNQLKLTAIKEDYRGFQYTSGRLRSKNWFLYGRIEVRAKLPGTGGMWPAIFLFGKDYTYTDYSVWPQCGEIDIIEVNGNSPNIAHTSVHTGYYNYNTGRPKHKQTTISGLTTQFRNYRIDWTPDYIRWFIDDVQVYEFLNDHIDTARWPFDSPVFLLMYLGVGGSFVGPVNDTALPQTMEVEYVKYYRMSDHLVIPQPTIPIPNPTPEHQVVNSGENLQVSCSAIPSHTIRWYINQIQVGTGTTLSIPNTGGLSPGNISVECVAVDGSNNIGQSATVTAQVFPVLPVPTSAQQSYSTEVGGTITITLTNRPTGADTQWYAGGPAGTGQLLYEGGWVLQIGPPNTNVPASMDLYIRYKQGDSYSGYYVIHVSIVEAGRTINVGTGSGVLSIDGSTLGGGLVAGDTVQIANGSYTSITLLNFNIPSGERVIVDGQGSTIVGEWNGALKFNNVVGAHIKNINVSNIPSGRSTFGILSFPFKRITIDSCNFSNLRDVFFRYSMSLNYVDESTVFSDIILTNCIATNVGIFNLGGSYSSSVDTGRCRNIEISHNIFQNRNNNAEGDSSYPQDTQQITIGNCQGYNIHHNVFKDIYTSDTSIHRCMIMAYGVGNVYNNKAINYYGQIARQWLFTRNQLENQSHNYNNIGYQNGRYSLFECQTPDAYIKPGEVYPVDYYCDFNTADTLGVLEPDVNTWQSVILDIYKTQGAVFVRNNLSINVNPRTGGNDWYQNAGGGSTPTASNNLSYNDYEEAGLLDEIDFIPASNSPIVDVGISLLDVDYDYYDVVRLDPPSVGACEPQ